jgi:hypothetical protein
MLLCHIVFYYSMISKWDVFLVNDFFKNSHTSSFTVTNSSSVMPNPSARFGCGSTSSSNMTNTSTYIAENSRVMPNVSARFRCGSTDQTVYDRAAVFESSYPHQSPVIQEIERRRVQSSVDTAVSQAGVENMPRIVLASGRSTEEETSAAASWSGCEGQPPPASSSGCEGQPPLASDSSCEGQTSPASRIGCEGQPPLASRSGREGQLPLASRSGCEGQPPLAFSPMPPDPGSGSEEQRLRAYNDNRGDQRPPSTSCVNSVETERTLGREGAITVEWPSVLPSVDDSRLPLVSAGEFTCPVVSAGGDFTFSSERNFSARPPYSAYSAENCVSSGHLRKEQPLIIWKEYPVLSNLF